MGSVSDQGLRKEKWYSAFEILSNLIKKNEERNAQSINLLRRKFLNVKQEKCESVESYISKLIKTKEELVVAKSAVFTIFWKKLQM